MSTVPHIIRVEQDDTNLILTFRSDQIPDAMYVNQMLLESLHKGYDNDIAQMLRDHHVRGTMIVSFCPDDNGNIGSDAWDALCTILDEYVYTLKDARTIIRWLDDCVKMEQVDHVYVEILEGASGC